MTEAHEVERAYLKLSKNAKEWFEDFELATRSGADLAAAPSPEEFDRRFAELPRTQRRYLEVLIRARQRQVEQAAEEARALQDLVLDWMNESGHN